VAGDIPRLNKQWCISIGTFHFSSRIHSTTSKKAKNSIHCFDRASLRWVLDFDQKVGPPIFSVRQTAINQFCRHPMIKLLDTRQNCTAGLVYAHSLILDLYFWVKSDTQPNNTKSVVWCAVWWKFPSSVNWDGPRKLYQSNELSSWIACSLLNNATCKNEMHTTYVPFVYTYIRGVNKF